MPYKQNPPSINETAFDCPHCYAYTTQYWYGLTGKILNSNNFPFLIDKNKIEELEREKSMDEKMLI